MTNGYSSSSDEEGGGFSPNSPQHRFHIQLPQQQLDLHKVRKQNQKKDNAKITKATSNFAKATKLNPKKKGGKFADSYSPRDPRFSMHSSQRSSFDGTGTGTGIGAGTGTGAGSSEDSDSDDFTPGEGMSSDRQNQNLPHFQFNADEIRKNQLQNKDNNDDDDEEEEDDDDEGEFQDQTHADFSNLNPPEHFYHTDSSDDENDDEEGENEHENYENAKNKMETKSIDRTRSRSSRKSATSSSNSNSNSSLADVVPPLRKPSFNSRASIDTERSRGNSGNSSGGIKGILRKMSLADRFPSEEHDISHSDTFLGRVFNIGNTGISGGGLAPGASRKSNESPEAMDEEKRVGFAEKENDRDAIEMKPIANFDDLSEEAKALIGQHLPPGVLHSNTTSAENSANVTPSMSPSQQHLLNEKDSNNRNRQGGGGDLDEQEGREDELDDAEKQRRSEERKKAENPFYAPNPDVFLRGHEDSHENFENGNDFLQDLDGDYIARPKQVQAGVLSSLLRLYQNPNEGKSTSSLTPTPSAGTGAESAYASSDEGSYYDHQNQKATLHFDITKLGSGVKSGFRKGMKKAESGVNMGYRGVQDAPNLPKNMYDRAANRLRKKENTNPEFDKPLPDDDSDASDGNEKYGDGAGGGGGGGGNNNGGDGHLPSFQNARPKMPKKKTSEATGKMKKKLRNKQRAERLRITVHIADILQRQRFIMNMCRALMMFGAPTHRLEEYMIMTSRVLEIDGQFMYFPGCMLVSFGDAATRTSEVHLVRCAQGLNLGKLTDTHKIYKAVIHDLIGVEEALKKLDELLKLPNKFPPWLCVLFYGLGSLAVTPFAFEGGWIDLPISFGVGLCVGYLQFYVSSMSNLYSSVFEVSAAIVVAFIARGIGSIRSGNLFCFSAITQGSLALILPGYIILCGSLELQSRNLVAGSVRMFYAVIYSLFLGFGITLGAALYGWVDHNATSQNSCQAGHAMDDKFRILFVPMFALMLGLINQAKFRQLPIMIVIASTGYVGTYFAGKHFSKVTEFTACIGAFIVGILGNLYSRIWKGMAVSAMLPAIFVQVPSGIASKSTLISGLQQADTITNKNGTTTTTTSDSETSSLSFGATMVEVSIGISVGLFAAALVVYPFGKKRTGLFTL